MKKYTANSSLKKLKVLKSAEDEAFYKEVIRDPYLNIPKSKQAQLIKEASKVVESAWGKFPETYLKNSILKSKYLLLLRNKDHKLIGVAPVKYIKIDGRHVYSFGLTVVDPDYQGLGFMKMMHAQIGRRVFVENILRLRSRVEFVFITPNIRTIGALAKIANFMYPNPYQINKKGKVKDADKETWETVNLFLEATNETFRKLDKNGCVMIGFYDDKPELIQKEQENVPDKMLKDFASNYLKPGNEVVVRSTISVWGLFRSGF